MIYRRLYPTGASSPKFYGLPKVHKQGMPLRPIVSSIWAVTYGSAKELSKILKSLGEKSPHHVQNNQEFIQHLKGIHLGPDEIIISYDVKALFTSVPIQPSLNIIEKLLEEDPGLQQRTSMTVKNIICLLEFCLRSTYFTFQNLYYEQVEGAAMGSPISPIVANLYVENFEIRAISTSLHPPMMWTRFVDDTCVVINAAHKQEFLEHINSINPHIQFTSEDSKPDGSMPLLDMMITPTEDGRLSTTVYRKPTHTDMYLKWDSHHPISSKYSVVGTLHHRAKTICSSPHMLQKEEDHLPKVLTRCKYPTWAINRVKMKMRTPAQKKKNKYSANTQQNCQNPYMVVPYYQSLSESVKRTCNKHGVQVYFRRGVTI